MPIKDKDKMLQKSDCTMPPPKDYPGKYNRNNSNGSLLTRSEWIKKEAEKWILNMKDHEKYDDTYFSVKAFCLRGWLQKTFTKISVKQTSELLFELEKTEDQDGDDDNRERDDLQEMEGEPEDLLDLIPDVEEMEHDGQMTRQEKEQIIKTHVDALNKESIENEMNLPEFVRCSLL